MTLTASDRLARALREDDSIGRRAGGSSVWEAPAIFSLRQWIQTTWAAGWPQEQLLHASQELALWRDAISADEAGAALLAPLSAAREARRADQLAIRYRMHLEPAGTGHSGSLREDHAAFLRWRQRVHARMRREHWLSGAQLPEALARRIDSGVEPVPARIRLAGFVNAPAPNEQALLDSLRAAGSDIEWATPDTPPSHVLAQRPADAETQFRNIALAIRAQLAPSAGQTQAPPRIVVALPDPDGRRELLESSFRPILAPWLEQASEGPRPCPWRWDSGRPLADQPYIDAALAVCELRLQGNAPASISRLLLSSAIWTDAERLSLARSDERLRDRGWPQVRMPRLLEVLAPPMRERFEALANTIRSASARALPSDWATHYGARLETLGWPGSMPLDSASFQTLREWPRLLARFSAMDGQLGRVNAGEALLWLRELARATRFEVRADHLQPILLMRLDEAASLPCDMLHVADLDATAIPLPAEASAYLPLELQIAAGVPGAAPAQTLERARALASALQTRAPQVCLYCPDVDERGAERLPSSLFTAASSWQAEPSPRLASALDHETAAGSRALIPASDPVPAVSAEELLGLRADSGLFRAWFESPFFAFCLYRLGVRGLELPRRGLDPRTQGNVVHGVLESVWSQLHDSAGLSARDAAALAVMVGESLDRLLVQQMPVADYGAVQVSLERERIADVIAQWLAHERRRVDAFTVERLESPIETVVGGLPLRLRIDRIDRISTPDGERWMVLDYKTGREADPRGWNVDRMSEPQLPLYASHAVGAATGVPRVDAICFAHLKDGHPALSALTNWRERLIEADTGRIKHDWDELLSLWRAGLEQAARGFLAGEAVLRPEVSARSNYAELLTLAGRDLDEDE